MPRRVLVTGASGGLGRKLIPALRERGWTVRALVHRTPVADADETVTGDVAAATSCADAIRNVDAVMHLAAATHARRAAVYDRVNTRGTEALVGAAATARVRRFVFVSTRANSVEGGPYSRSKRTAEDLVRRSGLDVVVVRLPEVYGLGGREGVDAIIDSARRGRAILIPGTGAQELAPLHADDVIGAVVAALERATDSGEYTLCGERTSILDFAQRCIEIYGSRSRIVRVPTMAVRAAGAASRVVPLSIYPDQLARLRAPKAPCTPEAERDLGVRLRSIDEGLPLVRRAG